MEIRLDYDRPEEGPGSGPLTVGWFLASDKGAVLYDPATMTDLATKTGAALGEVTQVTVVE